MEFISYKTEKVNDEIIDADKAIKILGGNIFKSIEFKLPNTNINRCILSIKKVKTTPKRYPRKAGLPNKEPIK